MINKKFEFTTKPFLELIDKVELPKFQRSVVWNEKKRKDFFDSITRGFPFGSLLLYKSSNSSRYQLIDGLQRLTTLKDIQENPIEYLGKEELGKILEELKIFENLEEEVTNIDDYKNDIISKLTQCFNGMQVHTGKVKAIFSDNQQQKNIIQDYATEITEKIQSISFEHLTLPVIIYSGDINDLPEIFSRLNANGTQLSKYEIFAAKWSGENYVYEIDDEEILKTVEKKYDGMIEKSEIYIKGYATGAILSSKRINLFEYGYALGKLVKEKYPILFDGKKEDHNKIDSIGFTLLAACLGNPIAKMSTLDDCFSPSNGEQMITLKDHILEICGEVNSILKPLITSPDGKYISKYIESQLVSFVSAIFNLRYNLISKKVENFNYRIKSDQYYKLNGLNFRANKDAKSKINSVKKNIPIYYLIDMIDEYWVASGDKKLDEMTKNIDNCRYLTKLSDEKIRHSLQDLLETQMNRSVKNIPVPNKLILNYLYNMRGKPVDSEKVDIEHIVPKKKFKEYSIDDKSISVLGNLCFLPSYENRSKKDKTLYEFSNEKHLLSKVDFTLLDKLYYPKEKDLAFATGIFDERRYLEFVKGRHESMIDEFIKNRNRVNL